MGEKMNSKKILKAGIGYIIGGVLIKGIAFITTPIFTRLLTTDEFGVLNTYLSYEAIMAVIIGFQFAASLKSAKIEFENVTNGVAGYLKQLLILLITHTGLFFIFINVFFDYSVSLIGINSRLLINLLVVNSFCNALVNVYNAYISLYYEYKKYVAIGLINALGNVIISLALIHTIMNNNRVSARIIGYVLPYILVSLYIIYQILKNGRSEKGSFLSFSYRYCSPLLPYACSDVMLGQFSKLYVEKKCGQSLMGIYSLSYNVYSIIGIIRIAMDYLVGPVYFEKRKINDQKGIQVLLQHYSRILGLASMGIMLLAPELIRILGSSEFYEARFSAIPLVAASYYIFLISTVSQEEYYQGKTGVVSIVSVTAMIFNVIANIIVVPQYGVLGASFCTMGTYFIMLISHLLVIRFGLKSDTFNYSVILLHSVGILIFTVFALLIVDVTIVRFFGIFIVVALAVIELCKAYKCLGLKFSA